MILFLYYHHPTYAPIFHTLPYPTFILPILSISPYLLPCITVYQALLPYTISALCPNLPALSMVAAVATKTSKINNQAP